MKDRDSELDEILHALIDLKPDPRQTRRWQSLPQKQIRKIPFLNRAIQLAAACLIGFVVGFYFKGKEQNNTEATLNLDKNATIEVVYTKNQ